MRATKVNNVFDGETLEVNLFAGVRSFLSLGFFTVLTRFP
jgi:hypothetical protein